MTRPSRKLGLALALAALAAPAAAADVQDDFNEGIRLYQMGEKAEALAKFHAVLAADPSNDEAYELWKSVDGQIFTDLLVEGGEYQKLAKRFLERATLGRRERENDKGAIDDIVTALRGTSNALERRELILTLSANHGEYAVPRLLPALADSGDGDWRVTAMHTLTEMDSDVVLPLIAALATADEYQRANVAMVLGYIADPRAAAVLQHLAETDADEKVQRAAGQGAMKCGASGSTLQQFLKLGDDYHHRRANVLRDFDYSRVLWSWEGGSLASHEVPGIVYNNELAKRAYYAALAVDPGSLDALAGVARECTDISSKLEALAARGGDTDGLQEQADAGSLAVAAAGVAAVDRALSWAVVTDDASSGVRLIRTLGSMATQPTPGLLAALDSDDGAMRGEAAVALGNIALASAGPADGNVVGMLGANAGREVVRIAVVIDANLDRANATISALEASGVLVNHRGNAAQGVALLHRLPGVDVIIVGDGLPDLTIDQVVTDAGNNPATADTPVVLMTADEDLGDAWSDRVAAVSSGADDLGAVDTIFEDGLTGDRAEADDLAARSATVLSHLAWSGHTDVRFVLDELTKPLAHRDDVVTIPAMFALQAAGTPDQVAALAGVVADGSRSDEARIAAASALGGIFGRHAVSADAGAGLAEVVADGDSSIEVRRAAATALGSIPAADRAGIVNQIRVEVRSDG